MSYVAVFLVLTQYPFAHITEFGQYATMAQLHKQQGSKFVCRMNIMQKITIALPRFIYMHIFDTVIVEDI